MYGCAAIGFEQRLHDGALDDNDDDDVLAGDKHKYFYLNEYQYDEHPFEDYSTSTSTDRDGSSIASSGGSRTVRRPLFSSTRCRHKHINFHNINVYIHVYVYIYVYVHVYIHLNTCPDYSTDNRALILGPTTAVAQATTEQSPEQTGGADTAQAIPELTSTAASSPDSAAAPLFTTIGTATDGTAVAATETASTNGAVSAVPSPNNGSVQSTIAVAGGVIGGVLAVSFLAFLFWWWRRRSMRKRRSTLLTPLTIEPTSGPDEKGEQGAYDISRGSIGPTPTTEKLKTAFNNNVKKIAGFVNRNSRSSSATSVNMNRGNSQFMDSTPSEAAAAKAMEGGQVTTKDRFLDWWSRLTADANFNWRLRNERMADSGGAFSFMRRGQDKEKKAAATANSGSQPDFLTLLGMDDRELDREAQRRRVSRMGGSASSVDHFLGGLSLNFGNDDPFSDANAVGRHESAKPAPLVVSQPNNPFSDANAISNQPKPSTYVADMRRSRGQSVGGNTTRPPSTVYRGSVASVESFNTRRNKFRSDPFDLERPELLAASRTSSNFSTAGSSQAPHLSSSTVGGPRISRPAGAHTRTESFTSKYSSGVSMGDWSDPGPDVGPAATKWPEPRESPTQGWRNRLEREAATGGAGQRRQSGASQTSVGKAM